ncbi:MAG: RNA 2',3'-cyclic phosphodiesterase [Verrucomicrobiae bacterium]|nr:RNA 2',3'-cyclic phosphodiesterase [Verrucomicrobiae bacterium]
MIRAFIAIDLPADIRAALTEAQARLQQSHAKVAWTKVENLHLTLQFLGRIPEVQVGEIGAALAPVAIRHVAFAVTVAGAGAFPDEVKPRVLWLGCDDAGGRLKALARDVRQAMTALGFQPDEHEFTPHLTLGRSKTPRPDAALTQALDSIKKDAFGTLRVEAIHLYQSQLHPDGSVYTKLSSHALKGDS